MARLRIASWRPRPPIAGREAVGTVVGTAAERLRSMSFFGADRRDVIQSLVALTILVLSSELGGVSLGESSETLAIYPGLFVMIPAAVALRGNIFGALGSRLGTAIHTGTFRLTLRPSSVVGENVIASLVLSFLVSLLVAVLGWATVLVVGVDGAIGLSSFVVISVVGGMLASVIVLVAALGLAAGSTRFGWDPDNVTAPLVTAAGDLTTVPALLLATHLVAVRNLSTVLSILAFGIAGVAGVAAWRWGGDEVRAILNESLPVLVAGVILDLIAGVLVERRMDVLVTLPELLVLLPAYLAAAGALGGILSSRLGSKLHLGLIEPSRVPGRSARSDIGNTFVLAVPVFVLSAVVATIFGHLFGLAGPALVALIAATLAGGIVATLVASVVAYYGTIAAVRFGLDPDTYGIPMVGSALDLVGAFTFIFAITAFGIV